MRRLTLGDVCRKASSNIAQKDLQLNEGVYPIFGASGLIKQVDFYQQDKEYIAVVKDGAGIGRTMLLPAYSSVIGTMQYLLPRADVDVDIRYLYYAITYMDLAKYFSGATIPHIYYKDYQKEPINIPKINEQRRIAQILGKIDAIIDLRNRQLAEIDQLVKSRFIEMFGDMLLNSIGWPESTLEVMADIVSGITKGRKVKPQRLTEVPYMAVSNVKDGYIDWTTVKTIMATEEEINQYRLNLNDVLMTEGGDPDKVGRGAVVRELLENCIHQNHIFRVRLNEKIISPFFFAEYLQHQKAKQYFLGCAKQTTGIASINMKQLRSLPVLLPPLELQNQFAFFVKKVDKSKYYKFRYIQTCQRMKRIFGQEWMKCQILSF